MKFGELKSIGHNIAHSLGSGCGLMVGVYEMDIYGEAAKSREGHITVDFLSGATSGATPSEELAKAIALYAKALDELFMKHGAAADMFTELCARFSRDSYGCRMIVTVRDRQGRQSRDEYLGLPGQRVKDFDDRGRIRPKRPVTTFE
jgi:hypothetical protein